MKTKNLFCMYSRPYDTDEDTTARFHFEWFFIKFIIKLKWIKPLFDANKEWKEPKWYGISSHMFDRETPCIMFYYGGESPSALYMPWDYEFVGYGDKTEFTATRFYDKHNDKYVEAKAYCEEYKYRWKALVWFKWWTIKVRKLTIDFSEEVGDRVGTWKGGTTRMTTPMLKGESVHGALLRIEERGL